MTVTRILLLEAWLLALSVAGFGWTDRNRHHLQVIADSWLPALGAWQ